MAGLVLSLIAAACGGSDSTESIDDDLVGSEAGDLVSEDTPRPVVVDTDMGADDIMALVFLLEHPAVDVRAITVSGTGLVRCDSGVPNVLSLLEQLGAAEIPVACGSATPIAGNNSFPPAWRDDADGFYGLATGVGDRRTDDRPAAQLLVDIVDSSPEPVTVLTLGPLTNLATAVEESPGIVDGIDLVYSMAGALNVAGNVEAAPDAEWNLFIDPEAATRVLGSGLVMTFITLDATDAVPLTPEVASRFDASESPGGQLIHDLIEGNRLDSLDLFLWDPLAAAAVIDASVAAYEMTEIAVRNDGSIASSAGGARTRVAVGGEPDRFDETFLAFYSPLTDTRVNSPASDADVVEGRLLWEFELEGNSVTPPGAKSMSRIDDGLAYFVGFDDRLYAVDVESGTLVWSRDRDLGGPAWVEVALSPEAVFYRDISVDLDELVSSSVGAADRATGAELWSVALDPEVEGGPRTPAYSDGVVYYGVERVGLVAADASTGETIWTFDAPMAVNAGAVAVIAGAVYLGALDGSVYAVEALSGEARWRVRSPLSTLGVTSTPAVADGVVYFGSDSGQFLAVAADSGEILWETKVDQTRGLPSSPTVADGRVYFGSLALGDAFGGLFALDVDTGEEAWRFGEPGGFVLSSPVYHDGALYFLSEGNLFVVDSSTGQERWRFEIGGSSDDSPVVVDGIVYFQAGSSYYAVAPPG
jgi:inosine-uridine nucleoside N-ribohydrolase/outer membrane protein assembly factor BamB